MLDKLSVERSANSAMVGRLKAHVMARAGKPRQAYDSLLEQQAKTPDDETRSDLQQYGRQLRKSDAQIDTDLRGLLDGARGLHLDSRYRCTARAIRFH